MKRKVGKEPERRSKKRKEVGNDNSLTSMFVKKQSDSDLKKPRDTYNTQLQKGKEMGLDEVAQVESVCRSEQDTRDIEGTETVYATVPKHSVDPKCIPKSFIPGATCEKTVTTRSWLELRAIEQDVHDDRPEWT